MSFHLNAQKMSEEARKQDLRNIFDQQKPWLAFSDPSFYSKRDLFVNQDAYQLPQAGKVTAVESTVMLPQVEVNAIVREVADPNW